MAATTTHLSIAGKKNFIIARKGCRDFFSTTQIILVAFLSGLMLNADIGLFINIDGNICDPAIDSGCEEGQIRNIPQNTECSPDGTSAGRVLAKCFAPFSEQSGVEVASAEAVESFHEDPVSWILFFAEVYERMLFHGNDPKQAGLSLVAEPTLAPTGSPTEGLELIGRGSECPLECQIAVDDTRGASATCAACITGTCVFTRNNGKICGRPRL